VTVRDDLSWDEVSSVAVHSPELPGVILDSGLLRDYPQGEVLAHILGYLGPPNERDQAEDPDPLLGLPEFRVGKSGIERTYDRELRGRSGLSRIEVNAVGREIRELDRDVGDAGRDLQLSLDLDLQRYCFERLSGELAASAVVVEVSTGAVLALASVPSFEPKAFLNGLSHGLWKELRDNPRTPLVNKCIRGQYPPGSTFKMMTGLAALEAGVISPTARVPCSGHMSLGSARFHCWKEHGHGALGMVEALEQSCDVYFYEAARRVGVDAIAAMGRRFGLGGVLGLDLPGELPWPDADARLEARPLQAAMAQGRDAGERHRPGLRPGDAAAARRDDGASVQWRPGGGALVRPPGPDGGTFAAGAGDRRRQGQSRPDAARHARCDPRPARHRPAGRSRPRRGADGRQDRHLAGEADQQGRPRQRRAQAQGPALEGA
jgi:penicillin-binding protein 2